MWIRNKEAGIEDASHLTDNTPEIQMDDIEQQEIVADIMRKMPAGDALLLTLYYLEENSVKEIAQIVGLNESNVKVKLFRARKTFKELLAKYYRKELRLEEL